MSDKKYVVPEGGLKAALGQVDYARAHSGVEEGIIKRALQDFVRWLSENPMEPTEQQVIDLFDTFNGKGHLEIHRITEWQRRMFLAPKEDYADRILKNASPGYTPNHAELDKIWEHIFRAGHGWTPPEQRKRKDIVETLRDGYPSVDSDGLYQCQVCAIHIDHLGTCDLHTPVIDLMERRMAEYSDWVHRNLQNLFDKKPLEPRLDWDKVGRKVFTYGDMVKK
jgi:hypothetical protein